jgi:hypothetical protein
MVLSGECVADGKPEVSSNRGQPVTALGYTNHLKRSAGESGRESSLNTGMCNSALSGTVRRSDALRLETPSLPRSGRDPANERDGANSLNGAGN